MLPQCSHITTKRGMYYYRRRLPVSAGGEICLSLRTKQYRIAYQLTMLLGPLFNRIVRVPMSDPRKLHDTINKYMREEIDRYYIRWKNTPAFSPAFGTIENSYEDAVAADVDELKLLKWGILDDLKNRDLRHSEGRIVEMLEDNTLSREERKDAARELLKAEMVILDTVIDLVQSGDLRYPERLCEPTKPTVTEPKTTPELTNSLSGSSQLLSDRLPIYLERMFTEEGWTGQTLSQNSMTE